jgi:hypothetical protein
MDLTDPLLMLIISGGFLYFNERHEVVQATTICKDHTAHDPYAADQKSAAPRSVPSISPLTPRRLERQRFKAEELSALEFASPEEIPRSLDLAGQKRWIAVNDPKILAARGR